jgi:hypothetical protein
MLSEFFGRTMKQANMWVGTLHDLTIELQHQSQNTVRRRVLRTEVEGIIFDFCHNNLVSVSAY